MAARATKDAVDRAVNGPDYSAALAIINGRIADAKESQSAASGRASQGWGDVEKLGVNKRGAQMFARIQAIEEDAEQQDQLRTFFALCQLEGIGLHIDLVDQAQGKKDHPVPTKPAPAAAAPAAPPPPGDQDLVDAGDDAAAATKGAAAGTALDAKPTPRSRAAAKEAEGGKVVGIEAARKHLGGGKPATPDATD